MQEKSRAKSGVLVALAWLVSQKITAPALIARWGVRNRPGRPDRNLLRSCRDGQRHRHRARQPCSCSSGARSRTKCRWRGSTALRRTSGWSRQATPPRWTRRPRMQQRKIRCWVPAISTATTASIGAHVGRMPRAEAGARDFPIRSVALGGPRTVAHRLPADPRVGRTGQRRSGKKGNSPDAARLAPPGVAVAPPPQRAPCAQLVTGAITFRLFARGHGLARVRTQSPEINTAPRSTTWATTQKNGKIRASRPRHASGFRRPTLQSEPLPSIRASLQPGQRSRRTTARIPPRRKTSRHFRPARNAFTPEDKFQ